MKTLVLYDSLHGNTEQIARAIGEALGPETAVKAVTEASLHDLVDACCLVVGAPTHGANASEPMKTFLASIPDGALKGVKAATFDTRMTWLILKLVGFAAPRIARTLKSRGAELIGKPEGFIVTDAEGPLAEGELARAAAWATTLFR